MKICGHCGQGNDDSSKFCMHCGAPLRIQGGSRQGQNADSRGTAGFGRQQSRSYENGRYSAPQEEVIYTDVTPRSIPVAVILSIVTCGIYALYWIYRLNDEVNELARDETAPGGGLVILLFIVTCGIYGLYWFYKMGEKCDYIAQTNTSNNIVYLLLSIFGLGIVALALIQDTINRVLE